MGPANSIASQVRSGRRSAVDVVEQALEAAEASHPELNAFTLIDTSGALHRAEGIDRLVEAGKDPGPLAGVPIGLKDLIDDAGMPTTSGGSFPTEMSTTSSTVVRRLGAAGAVIIGRTGLHEWAFGFTSENPWFGPVRNPWDTSTSPGGSSGGSGAVVAAGVVPVSIGTDTGGSVRVPAALCGVLGLKVTHGRVPLTGVKPLVGSLDTVGPLARSVDDLAATYLAIAGDDPADPWSQPRPVVTTPNSEGPFTLGIVTQWMAGPVSAAVQDAIARFADRCRAAGIGIVEVDEPLLAPSPSLVDAIAPEILAVHEARWRAHRERYGRDVAARIEAALDADPSALVEAERWGSAARATVQRLSNEGVTALVGPTVGSAHKVIGVDTMMVDGTDHFHRDVLARYTAPINRMKVPAIAAPVAAGDERGESVQLVGPMWSEGTLLGVAATLEQEGVIGIAPPPIHFA